MADGYREILKAEGRKLAARAESSLSHKGARGDQREELVREFLAERVGSSFGVAKAELIDALGRSTGEYDAVIYDQRTTACAVSQGGRKIVRVEYVAMTLEVKSELSTRDLEKVAKRSTDELLKLSRYYRPTALLSAFGPRTPSWPASQRVFKDGLTPLLHHENIPSIVGAVFAFGGIERDTAAHPHLQSFGVDLVCGLNAYTIAKGELGFSRNPPELLAHAQGDESLGAFMRLVEEVLANYLESCMWVTPNWHRYYNPYPLVHAAASSNHSHALSAADLEPEPRSIGPVKPGEPQ